MLTAWGHSFPGCQVSTEVICLTKAKSLQELCVLRVRGKGKLAHLSRGKYDVGVEAFVFSPYCLMCYMQFWCWWFISTCFKLLFFWNPSCWKEAASYHTQLCFTSTSCSLSVLISLEMAERKMELFSPKPSTKEQKISFWLYFVGWLLKK